MNKLYFGDNLDILRVIGREKAPIVLRVGFVTLAPPARMIEEATGCGFYDEARFGTRYPKIQVLTIEGLMSGTERAEYPDFSMEQGTFKKTAVEEMSGEQQKIF